ASAALRDQMIVEIKALTDGDGLALWAHKRLPAKNSLTAGDAAAVEAAYQGMLAISTEPGLKMSTTAPPSESGIELAGSPIAGSEAGMESLIAHVKTPIQGHASDAPQMVTPIQKTIRQRNRAHLRFI